MFEPKEPKEEIEKLPFDPAVLFDDNSGGDFVKKILPWIQVIFLFVILILEIVKK